MSSTRNRTRIQEEGSSRTRKRSRNTAINIEHNNEDEEEHVWKVPPGGWVRVKRGIYAGDLAQVIELLDSQNSARIKLVPRLHYKKEKRSEHSRPPKMMFDPEKVDSRSLSSLEKNGLYWKFRGDHFRDGLLEKTSKLVTLQTENVNPTPDEIALFPGSNELGNYELHDLVQLESFTVGVIVNVDRNSFEVLTQYDELKTVNLHQITSKLDSTTATDMNRTTIRSGDTVMEFGGDKRICSILHLYRNLVFLHSRELKDNYGVWVSNTRAVVSTVNRSSHSTTNPAVQSINDMNSAPTPGASCTVPTPAANYEARAPIPAVNFAPISFDAPTPYETAPTSGASLIPPTPAPMISALTQGNYTPSTPGDFMPATPAFSLTDAKIYI